MVIDPMTGDPAILLEDDAESATITVPADPGGAESVICEQEGIHHHTPHSLLYRFFVRHDIRVNRLEIGRTPAGGLSSALCYRHDGHSFRMDVRPADGIALATQASAPMFVSTELIHDYSRTISSPLVLESIDLLMLGADTQSGSSESAGF